MVSRSTRLFYLIFALSFLISVSLSFVTVSLGVQEYLFDTLLAVGIMWTLLLSRGVLRLGLIGYGLIGLALTLHNLGMFGFYNISPVAIQWDHITHFAGFFAVTLSLWGVAREAFSSRNVFFCVIFLILMSLGVGVFVEFLEFFGSLTVGDGMGVLGHGEGDVNTEFGASEWLNTIFDFFFNLLGSVAAIMSIFLHRHFFPHKTYKER